mgnify:CR=1 FL=1
MKIIFDLFIGHRWIFAQKKGSGTRDDGGRHGGAATGCITGSFSVIGRAAGDDVRTGSDDIGFGNHPLCWAPAGIVVNPVAAENDGFIIIRGTDSDHFPADTRGSNGHSPGTVISGRNDDRNAVIPGPPECGVYLEPEGNGLRRKGELL